MNYKVDVLYTAYVDIREDVHRIYFMFHHYREGNMKSLFIKKGLKDGWNSYTIGVTDTIQYVCPEGIWRVNFHIHCNPTWMFYFKGANYEPTISAMDDDDYKGKHYEAVIEDDMVDAFGYAVTANKDVEKEVKQVTKWYERTRGIDFANPLQPKIKFTSKKEVKGEMLQLIDVIIFNRKTEVVDFRKDIVAPDRSEAALVAVQEFGKYNPKIHIIEERCILEFTEIKDK